MLEPLIAELVAAGRSVCFAPVPGFQSWVNITITDPVKGEFAEASCSRREHDVHTVLRRLVAQTEG